MEQRLLPTARSSAQRSRIAIVPALLSKFASGQTQGSAERSGLCFGLMVACTSEASECAGGSIEPLLRQYGDQGTKWRGMLKKPYVTRRSGY
jgi:hypothetical protein